MVCVPVRRDNPRALASDLKFVNYRPCGKTNYDLICCISRVDFARYRISRATSSKMVFRALDKREYMVIIRGNLS